MSLYDSVVRPLAFLLDPEKAHETAMWMLERGFFRAHVFADPRLEQTLFGVKFPNPLGLAAGFDKNGRALSHWHQLGFGFVEAGTITYHAQPGNPKPRMFRLPADKALINRLGFNNEGSEAIAARLSRQAPPGRRRIPLGINLGKSKAAEIDRAPEDYLASFARLADHADYVVLNVSSPNTPGLRKLQDESRLRELLSAVTHANLERASASGKPRVPILLKIAPDLGFAQIDAALGVVSDHGLDGLIATNTTLARPGALAAVAEEGGLSGAPLRGRSTEVIGYVSRATEGRLPIIGVGGITDVRGAAEKLDAGAALVQVYTGLIYRGPFLAAELARGVADRQSRWVSAAGGS